MQQLASIHVNEIAGLFLFKKVICMLFPKGVPVISTQLNVFQIVCM